MLAIISSVLPITSAVPLHSTMMLGLSLSRFWYFRKEVRWQIVAPFLLGCCIGVFFGGRVYFDLSEFLLSLVIGVLILAAVWMPKSKVGGQTSDAVFLGGHYSLIFINPVFIWRAVSAIDVTRRVIEAANCRYAVSGAVADEPA